MQITDLCAGAVASCYESEYHQRDMEQIKEELIEINKGIDLSYAHSTLPKLHDYRLHHWLFDEAKSKFSYSDLRL